VHVAVELEQPVEFLGMGAAVEAMVGHEAESVERLSFGNFNLLRVREAPGTRHIAKVASSIKSMLDQPNKRHQRGRLRFDFEVVK
jgi:hypothetical protein